MKYNNPIPPIQTKCSENTTEKYLRNFAQFCGCKTQDT